MVVVDPDLIPDGIEKSMKSRVGSVEAVDALRTIHAERRLRDIVGHTREVNLEGRHAFARDPHKSLGDAEVFSDEAFESHLSCFDWVVNFARSRPRARRGLVASKPPSPKKTKTSKNDEKLTILQYLQKKAKTSNSYSIPVSKTSKNDKNFEIWPKLQEMRLAQGCAKTSRNGENFEIWPAPLRAEGPAVRAVGRLSPCKPLLSS